jgi:hypothetical protein
MHAYTRGCLARLADSHANVLGVGATSRHEDIHASLSTGYEYCKSHTIKADIQAHQVCGLQSDNTICAVEAGLQNTLTCCRKTPVSLLQLYITQSTHAARSLSQPRPLLGRQVATGSCTAAAALELRCRRCHHRRACCLQASWCTACMQHLVPHSSICCCLLLLVLLLARAPV